MENKQILINVLSFYTVPQKELIINYGKLVHEAKAKPNELMANSNSLEVTENFELIPMKEFIELIEGQYFFIKSLIEKK